VKTIPLYGGKAHGRVMKVDDGDYDMMMARRWTVKEHRRPGGGMKGPYATTGTSRASQRAGGPRNIFAHTLITGLLYVDHRNGDGLDNQRHNLRPATQPENLANTGSRGGTSRYKGVSWDRRRNKWRAGIMNNRQLYHLGMFTDEDEAARAYDAAAIELQGEFARPNFPAVVTKP
jgi:AP2 domain